MNAPVRAFANDHQPRGPRLGRGMAGRVDLAAAYRLVAMFRWDDLVFTHIIRARARAPSTS